MLVPGTEGVPTLSVTPESRNVSEGKMVEFSCATRHRGVTITWETIPHVETTNKNDTDLSGGGMQSVLSFIATAQHNNTTIICIVVNSGGSQSTAFLFVQGKSTQISLRVIIIIINKPVILRLED